MTQMLRGVIIGGTGGRARVGGYDLAGKTGTTSDYKDAWFVGFTGGFVAAVWVGKDDNTPMRKVTGGGAPAEIWRDFMVAALPKLAIQPIPGGPPTAQDAPPTEEQPADEDATPDAESPQNPDEAPPPRAAPRRQTPAVPL
jgi:penicillin-binding protein 1A